MENWRELHITGVVCLCRSAERSHRKRCSSCDLKKNRGSIGKMERYLGRGGGKWLEQEGTASMRRRKEM